MPVQRRINSEAHIMDRPLCDESCYHKIAVNNAQQRPSPAFKKSVKKA